LSAVAFCSLGCRSPDGTYERIKAEVDRGEFNSTLVDVDKALQRFGRHSVAWEWRFRVLKARILVSRSQGQEALSILKPELPSELNSTDLPEQRKLYQGIAHRYSQQFSEAEREFQDAEPLVKQLGAQYVCQFLVARAALWVDEKKYESAETSYRQALDLARRSGLPRSEASALADWGRLATTQGHFDQALDLYHDALERAESLGMQANTATILGNLGWSYFELGDFENALNYYQQAAKTSQRSGIAGYQLYWFTGVANSYIALHDYATAETLSQQTLESARNLKNAQSITECLNTLAELALRGGRLTEADHYNQEAMAMEEAGLDHFGVLESSLLSGRIATAQKQFARAEKMFHRVIEDPGTESALRWEAQARLAEVHNAEGLVAKADQEYRKCIDTIETARSGIDRADLRLSYLSGGIEFYDDYIRFLISHGRTGDALRVAELSRARTLAEGLGAARKPLSFSLRNFEPTMIATRLGATLLFYWLGQRESYLWVITPARVTCLTLPSAASIDARVKSYRDVLLSGRDVLATDNADAKELYRVLVAPAKGAVAPGSLVILLPDGSLYGLNFETLLVPEPKPHFWIEDVTLTTASSLSLLLADRRNAVEDKQLLLVGNAVSASKEFPALRQAASEIGRVERHFDRERREVLAGAWATPGAYLKSQPERFAYLHFVTHGTASRAHPLESAVILSAEGKDPASYKLYARDIVAHPLSAYLVTISACNGSGTRAYSGEGLVGLSWAFLRAGARNVIAALWEVNDASTPQLMDTLYGELSRGQDPATALRAAKLSLLHSDGVFQKPFYWAPFQVYAGSSAAPRQAAAHMRPRRNAD